MNVLSLFDGLSCGQLALQRADIDVENYYASEIDKYTIKITQKNFPNTIQLGDILLIDFNQFIGKIDLLLGGSPCQSLSCANPNGKGLNGDKSILFWKYVKALNTIRPKYFLFENVASMKTSDKNIITKELGVEPILIDSALVSAQRRKRYYWTNIPGVVQPSDKNILLKDILLAEFPATLLHSATGINYMNRKTAGGRTHWDFAYHSDRKNDKSSTLVANLHKGVPFNVLIDGDKIRKFDPIEAEKLQTMPINYTEGVSNTQRYKAIGNGWTIDVIAHILMGIKGENYGT